MRPDYYKILQVRPDADAAIIKAAYKSLVLKLHPDRNPSRDAEEKMKELNEAYGALSDEAKRAAYDEQLRQENVSEDVRPPRPRSIPTSINLGRVVVGMATSSSLIVTNEGGPARHVSVDWSKQYEGLDVRVIPASAADPFPLTLEISLSVTPALAPGKWSTTLKIGLDDQFASVAVSFEVQPAPVVTDSSKPDTLYSSIAGASATTGPTSTPASGGSTSTSTSGGLPPHYASTKGSTTTPKSIAATLFVTPILMFFVVPISFYLVLGVYFAVAGGSIKYSQHVLGMLWYQMFWIITIAAVALELLVSYGPLRHIRRDSAHFIFVCMAVVFMVMEINITRDNFPETAFWASVNPPTQTTRAPSQPKSHSKHIPIAPKPSPPVQQESTPEPSPPVQQESVEPGPAYVVEQSRAYINNLGMLQLIYVITNRSNVRIGTFPIQANFYRSPGDAVRNITVNRDGGDDVGHSASGAVMPGTTGEIVFSVRSDQNSYGLSYSQRRTLGCQALQTKYSEFHGVSIYERGLRVDLPFPC